MKKRGFSKNHIHYKTRVQTPTRFETKMANIDSLFPINMSKVNPYPLSLDIPISVANIEKCPLGQIQREVSQTSTSRSVLTLYAVSPLSFAWTKNPRLWQLPEKMRSKTAQ